jgi:methylglutaconyl-CoA hydratase
MQFAQLLYETSDRKALITLNRPDKRNALDDILVSELTMAFAAAGKDQSVKVILFGAKGPAFCAGADLDYLRRIASFDLEEHRRDSLHLANLYRLLHEIRKPVICIVNGVALAGGCGLVSVCDFVIASEEHAHFGYPEVRIGFIPAIVMIFLAKRLGEGRARELILRGNVINAPQAKEIGLVSMVVPERQLEETVHSLADELIGLNSLNAMGLCKEMLSKMHSMNLPDALEFAANMNAAARMTEDFKKGITAFLSKSKMQW